MKPAQTKSMMPPAAVISLILLISALASAIVFAHGGKNHGPGIEFTNLEALKKATEMYDKLVASSKLDVSWETTVEKVQIAELQKGSEVEKLVSFSRASGEPKTVYFFFKANGDYAGSNFTGQ